MPKKSIRAIYKVFGLRYDVREARKLLELPVNTPKKEVNRQLKLSYEYIFDEYYKTPTEKVYMYEVFGESRYELTEQIKRKDGSIYYRPSDKLSKPFPISMSFQSKEKFKLHRCNLYNLMNITDNIKKEVGNNYPFANVDTNEWDEFFNGNFEVAMEWMNQGTQEATYKINTLHDFKRQLVPTTKKKLKDMPLYNASINLPYKEFRGFKDKGNGMCVPETVLHHLQLNNRNKKLTLKKLIDDFEMLYPEEEEIYEVPSYMFEEPLEGEPENIDEYIERGKRGYTAEDIKIILDKYGCNFRLLDINGKEFLTSDNTLKKDRHLLTFVGIVYNEHLYYCDNKDFVKSISGHSISNQQSTGFMEISYENKKKIMNYEIVETYDLLDYYINEFKNDNTIRQVITDKGRITRIIYDDKIVCANADKSVMIEILGDEFTNENLTMLGEKEFNEYFPNHTTSSFNKFVFDVLDIHGGLKKCYNIPTLEEQDEYDYNKMRTSCWMYNKLGDYERFDPTCQIELYDGEIKKGIYYTIVEDDDEFFMNGSRWYSGDYVSIGLKYTIGVVIKYQILASSVIDKDYFKSFCEEMIKKYPIHYKKIINTCIGYRGKTSDKKNKGYIETDYELAVSAFWDNNEERIGFMTDNDIDKKLWKIIKGNMCNIKVINIDKDTKYYMVETTKHQTLYQNDLPIYNKVLENEYLRIFELKQLLGKDAKIIKIKTDAIIVEGKHNKIKTNDKIGGIKHNKLQLIDCKLSTPKTHPILDLDLNLSWNIVEEKEDYTIDTPTGSFLVTGLAGYGKSYLVQSMPEFQDKNTLILGFTNVSIDNISNETNVANTLNSYFGINFQTQKCSKKKIENLKKIKNIIVTEVFMIPPYLMSYLSIIKHEFSDIKFICEGDPEQLRPVNFENLNWLYKQLLYVLCDGNLVQLKYNKRNNETENYIKIFNNQPLDNSKFSDRPPQQLNLTKSNKYRISINDNKMDKTGYFIPKTKKNKYSQDIWINIDTPIMCVKNNKKLNIKNGAFYTLTCVSKDNIIIRMKDGDTLTNFTDDMFSEHFVVAYAVTNHKVQSITIRHNYNIYEWNKMTTREKYTAYSRTGNADYVKIISKYEPNNKLYEELKEYFSTNYIIYMWKSLNENDKNIYIGSTIDFDKRKEEHIRACNDVNSVNYKFYIYDYIRNHGGINNWEMLIVDKFYAENTREAEKMEQYYINTMMPSLNSKNSYKLTE